MVNNFPLILLCLSQIEFQFNAPFDLISNRHNSQYNILWSVNIGSTRKHKPTKHGMENNMEFNLEASFYSSRQANKTSTGWIANYYC